MMELFYGIIYKYTYASTCLYRPDRIDHMRQLILSTSTEEQHKALQVLEPIQERDFLDIFRLIGLAKASSTNRSTAEAAAARRPSLGTAMKSVQSIGIGKGTQVTIRLLDPPLHEFLPNPKNKCFEQETAALANRIGMSAEECMEVRNLCDYIPISIFYLNCASNNIIV